MPDPLTGEVTELLQVLIRNQCVNDGSVESGHEDRSADILTNVLEGPGVDIERYEPEPGRTSVVARIEGSNPSAPSLATPMSYPSAPTGGVTTPSAASSSTVRCGAGARSTCST
jgi:acetylornithine deacetylase/succinyl-diaminopimelate desuccinylase-like protein